MGRQLPRLLASAPSHGTMRPLGRRAPSFARGYYRWSLASISASLHGSAKIDACGAPMRTGHWRAGWPVLVLPSGLAAALAQLRLSPLNAVGIGDAENDHA